KKRLKEVRCLCHQPLFFIKKENVKMELTLKEAFDEIKKRNISLIDYDSYDTVKDYHLSYFDSEDDANVLYESKILKKCYEVMFEEALRIPYEGKRLNELLVETDIYISYFHFHNEDIGFYPVVTITLPDGD